MSGRMPAPATGATRPGWLARLFGARRGEPGMTSDPALLLARDWLLARGGRVRRVAPDLIEGALPDRAPLRYTGSPRRARQESDTVLLLAGTPEWGAMQRDIAERAAGQIARVRWAPEEAAVLAHRAFVPPAAGCVRCSQTPDALAHGSLCAACPLRQGRMVVAGTGAVRRVTVERASERLAYEYAFRLRVTSAQAEREEIVRVAVDGASGARLTPLELTLLAGAEEVRDTHAPGVHGATGDGPEDGPGRQLAEAERSIEPVAWAAARLARAQALPEYERRQDELDATFARLLVEDPAAGREALGARERALERLAEMHAIGVETQLVAATAELTPWVGVRVRFGGGAEAHAEVDPVRQTVTARCEACGEAWQVGARCGAGHVTCVACLERCAHCGAGRCPQCATAAYTSCTVCGAAACAGCARATARGRHRVPEAPNVATQEAADAGRKAQSEEDEGAKAGADDLKVADLDCMTHATWRDCVVWLLTGMGYMIEREFGDGEPDLALVCGAPGGAGDGAAARKVAVIAQRPGAGLPCDLAPTDLERARRQAGRVEGARALLLTTARTDGQVLPGIEVVDRMRLAAWLAEQRAASQRARDTATAEMDARAAAAGRVRALLTDGLEQVQARLSARPAGADGERSAAGAGDWIAHVEAQTGTARQALAALETLIAQWEAAFAPTATREGTQAIAASREELGAMAERADHLLGVLSDTVVALGRTSEVSGDAAQAEWPEALRDELSERCQALAARARALNPAEWRAFAAVRDDAAARASVAHEAAARRVAARARAARDALNSADPRARRATRSAAGRKRA